MEGVSLSSPFFAHANFFFLFLPMRSLVPGYGYVDYRGEQILDGGGGRGGEKGRPDTKELPSSDTSKIWMWQDVAVIG